MKLIDELIGFGVGRVGLPLFDLDVFAPGFHPEDGGDEVGHREPEKVPLEVRQDHVVFVGAPGEKDDQHEAGDGQKRGAVCRRSLPADAFGADRPVRAQYGRDRRGDFLQRFPGACLGGQGDIEHGRQHPDRRGEEEEVNPPHLPGQQGEAHGDHPGDEGRGVDDLPLAMRPELVEADPRKDPVLDDDNRADRHQQQPVKADELQQSQEDEGEAGDRGRDGAGNEGHEPSRPAGGDDLEGQSGSVEGGVGGGPAGDHNGQCAGDAQGGEGDLPGVEGDQRLAEHLGGARSHDARADPGHVVAEQHAKRGIDAVPRAFGEAEQGHVRQPDVHRQVADPGEARDVPEADFLGRVGRNAGPDLQFGEIPERLQIAEETELLDGDHRPDDEHQEHPGGAERGELGEALESEDRQQDDNGADADGDDHEPGVGRQPSGLGRDAEGNPHGRGRDGDHASGEHAVEQGVEDVVNDHHHRPADLAEVPVECQSRVDGNRRADQRPGEDGQEVSQEEPDKDVVGRGAPHDESRPDDELGGGDVFAGEASGEVPAAAELFARDWFAVKFVELVQPLEYAGFAMSRRHTLFSRQWGLVIAGRLLFRKAVCCLCPVLPARRGAPVGCSIACW